MINKFPKFKEVSQLNSLRQIDEEIYLAQKTLFELKIHLVNSRERAKKKINDPSFGFDKKPHYFIFLKRRLAHLKYQQSLLLKNELKNR